MFIQRFSKLINCQQSPGEVAMHLRQVETYLEGRRVIMFILIGKTRRGFAPGVHATRSRHIESGPCPGEIISKSWVHATMDSFEKPPRAALHHSVNRCRNKRYLLFHCYPLTQGIVELKKHFLRSLKSNLLARWKTDLSFTACICLRQLRDYQHCWCSSFIHNIFTSFQMKTLILWVYSQKFFNAVQRKILFLSKNVTRYFFVFLLTGQVGAMWVFFFYEVGFWESKTCSFFFLNSVIIFSSKTSHE